MNLSTFSSNPAARTPYCHIRLKRLAQVVLFATLLWSLDRGIYSLLSRGLKTYYGLDKEAQVLCLGHSHTVLGIDAKRLEQTLGVPVAKYAIAGANTMDRLAMAKHYLGLHPQVKWVTYDVDARLFDSDGLSSASYSLFLPFIDAPGMSHYLRREASAQEYGISKWIKTARFRDQTLNQSIRGLLNWTENSKHTRIIKSHYNKYMERERQRGIRLNPKAVAQFYETIEFLSSKGVKVILIHLPVIDFLNNIDRAKYDDVLKLFYNVSEQYKNVLFLNYGPDYESHYDLFFDPRHLNNKGKDLVTKRLANDIKIMMKENLISMSHLY